MLFHVSGGLQVSQEPVLYARSIRHNILYGLEAENGVPHEEVGPLLTDLQADYKVQRCCDPISCLLGTVFLEQLRRVII